MRLTCSRRSLSSAPNSLWNKTIDLLKSALALGPNNHQHRRPSLPEQLVNYTEKPCHNHVVLCHGLFGFDKRGPESFPFLVSKYWHAVEKSLVSLGVKVHVCSVPSTGSVRERALVLKTFLERQFHGESVNLIAHSMGGLDCRYLITHLGLESCKVESLTTIATPHQGSHFMDYLRDTLGVGLKTEELSWKLSHPSLLEMQQRETLLEKAMQVTEGPMFRVPKHTDAIPDKTSPLRPVFSTFDRPAYHNLTTDFCQRVFNPLTPDSPNVKYFSYGAYLPHWPIGNPLKWAATIIDSRDGPNDGLVSLNSARWGEYKGTVECDHWDLCGRWKLKVGNGRFDVEGFWRGVSSTLAHDGL